MILALFLVILGLVCLVAGGEWVIRGSKAICLRFGISELIVGLFVISFGTSVPELAVNLAGSIQGHGELCFGNIVGSNIANIGLILGTAALISPLCIPSIVVSREIPMLLMASAVAVVLGFDRLFSEASVDLFSRGDAIILLLLFMAFFYYSLRDVLEGKNSPLIASELSAEEHGKNTNTVKATLLVIAGFIALAAGGKLTVAGAVDLALMFGISKALVGLTVVAIGTSLPELVTSVSAVRHGEVDMAVGNVVGSNLFNLLFVLGVSSFVRPVPIPANEGSALWVMFLFILLFWPLAYSDQKKIVRWEGAVFLIFYFAYIGLQAFGNIV